jgi:uncharacterized membrane protein
MESKVSLTTISWRFLLENDVARVVALAAFISQSLHMVEHSAQMYQHIVLGLPPQLSNGLLFFLDLEWNHFLFNALYFALLAVLYGLLGIRPLQKLRQATGTFYALLVGLYVQAFHVAEHTYRLYQFITSGCTPCRGIIGGFFNMVHLHFILNTIAYIPIVLIVVKSGLLKQYLGSRGEGEPAEKARFQLYTTPLILSAIVVYSYFLGYGIDLYVLGSLLFTSMGVALFLSIKEGFLEEQVARSVTVALIAALTVNTSYLSAVFLAVASIVASQIIRENNRPGLNNIAITMTLIMLLSSPSLINSRWGNYGYFTLFTFMFIAGIASTAVTKTLSTAASFLLTWVPLYTLIQFLRLQVEGSETVLLLLSTGLKALTNPFLLVVAFYVAPMPRTVPARKLKQLLYGTFSALAGLLFTAILPVDIAALAGISLANVSLVALNLLSIKQHSSPFLLLLRQSLSLLPLPLQRPSPRPSRSSRPLSKKSGLKHRSS